jgi:hypothetical protein
MTSIQRALAIRDAVLPWLHEHGNLMTFPCKGRMPVRLLCGGIDGFTVTHRTPFSNAPLPPVPRNYAEGKLLQTMTVPLPYELDIGRGNCRLIIEWSDDGRTNLRRFEGQRRRWDADLIHSVEKTQQ